MGLKPNPFRLTSMKRTTEPEQPQAGNTRDVCGPDRAGLQNLHPHTNPLT